MPVVHVVTTSAGIGRVEDGEIALLRTPFPHLGAVLAEDGSLGVLDSCAVLHRVPLDEAVLRAPLGTPRAVWGVGLNYRSKAERTGRALPEAPILYLAASSAVAAPGAAVTLPAGQTVEMDYEGELAVVLGRRLYRADPDEVWPAVAGITAANDMTARDVMRSSATPTLAKSFPGFNPLGASLCTPDEIADRDRILVRCWVNGELRQDDTTAGMIFPIPDLVARISWFAALEPGDVVLTGTPAGTGQDRGEFLQPGDRVQVAVGPVLPLDSTVIASPTRPRDLRPALADRTR